MPEVSFGEARGKTELRPRFQLKLDEYVSALEILRDGTLGVVGLGDGRVVGVDPLTGLQVFSVRAHPGSVFEVSAAPNGSRFVTCGHDAMARVWTRDGSVCCELPSGGNAMVEHAAWSPDGTRIATSSGRKVRLWSALGEPLLETEALESTVAGLAWRGDGTGLAAICYGGVHILPFVPGARVRHLAWKGSLISLAWSPDAKVIACGTQDCSVHFWRLATGKDSQMSGYPFKPRSLAWDSESRLLATSGDAAIMVWDFRGKGPEGTRPMQLESHKGVCTRLVFSPRKGVLASGSQDTSVLLWEPRRGVKPIRYAFLQDEITGLAWHPEHHTLVGTDASGTVSAWAVT